MKKSCSVLWSETCRKCTDKKCSKSNIVETIMSCEDSQKVQNLYNVMEKYELAVQDYIS